MCKEFLTETNYNSVKSITDEQSKMILENNYIYYNKEYYHKYQEDEDSDLYEFQGLNDVSCHLKATNGVDYIIFIGIIIIC
ncbi:MAG: hypothetical protein IPO92_16760 [Saprospiraceae bacterium]|nr:hypothetical protein [Saprospiraceae bacterium]